MRTLLIALAATLLTGLAGAPLAAEASDPEDQLKAATVLAILQHTKWPGSEGEQKLSVGVWGRPAMAEALKETLEGKIVNGRAVRVIALPGSFDPRCCRALYVATSRKAEMQKLLTGAIAGHVLTIGEDDRFLDHGGALSLFVADGHMAFEVSLSALEQSGHSISSKLLRFGRVRDKNRRATQ